MNEVMISEHDLYDALDCAVCFTEEESATMVGYLEKLMTAMETDPSSDHINALHMLGITKRAFSDNISSAYWRTNLNN